MAACISSPNLTTLYAKTVKENRSKLNGSSRLRIGGRKSFTVRKMGVTAAYENKSQEYYDRTKEFCMEAFLSLNAFKVTWFKVGFYCQDPECFFSWLLEEFAAF